MRTVPLQTAFGGIESTVLAAVQQGAVYSSTVATDTPAETIITIENAMYQHIAALDALETTKDLDKYAKDQFSDQSYVIATDITQTRNACGLVIAQTLALMPRSDGSDVATYVGDANGRVVPKVFPAAQLADLKTALDTLAGVRFGPA